MNINVPDYDGGDRVHTLVGNHIVFVFTARDENPIDPMEEGRESGKILSMHADRSYTHDPVGMWRELNYNRDAVPLWFRDGNNVTWEVARRPVNIDAVWVPCKGLIGYAEDAGEAVGSVERRARMQQYAAQLCEELTHFCNGDVFGYDVQVYEARWADGELLTDLDDYIDHKPLYEDSCWGFVGEAYFEEALEAELTHVKTYLITTTLEKPCRSKTTAGASTR